jgi:hypothetical protein
MDATDRWMTRLGAARKRRDDNIALANREFKDLVVQAHKAGLTAVEIRLATGVSAVTLRTYIRAAQLEEAEE